MRSATSSHLIAFSQMLARDPDASRLNTRDLQVLAAVVAHGKPLSRSTLAMVLSIDPTVISRTTMRLAKRGLVLRSKAEAMDGRLVMISPTEEGAAIDTRIKRYFHDARPRASAAA